MCSAIALAYSELSKVVIEKHDMDARTHDREGEKKVRFHWQAHPALLPVWWNGRLHAVRCGNEDWYESKLPPTGWA